MTVKLLVMHNAQEGRQQENSSEVTREMDYLRVISPSSPEI